MTGVRVAVGDGAIRRGNGHFQRHSANVLLVHRFHGAIRIRCVIVSEESELAYKFIFNDSAMSQECRD